MTDLETRVADADAIVAELAAKLAELMATAEREDDDEVWMQVDELNDELEAAMYRADFTADE